MLCFALESWVGLFMLREFKERSSIYDCGNNDDNKKKTSMFLPNQNEPFQVTEKIWILFTATTDEGGEGDKKTEKHKDYCMRIYVKSKKDRLFLLQVWIFEKKR